MTASATPQGRVARRPLVVRAVQLVVQDLVIVAVLLGSAGTLRWPNAWAFGVLYLVLVAASTGYVLPRNPEIVAERGRVHRGTRTFDSALMAGYTVVYLGMFVLAGFDAGRFGWYRLGWPWAVAGGVLLAAGMAPIVGALAVNRNLEPTVRIQDDRGHAVAADGPYRLVRHPMYVGMLVQLLAVPLLLGSGLALLPALVCAVLLVVRTALEDRLLFGELSGYADYASGTRYRLVPGLW